MQHDFDVLVFCTGAIIVAPQQAAVWRKGWRDPPTTLRSWWRPTKASTRIRARLRHVAAWGLRRCRRSWLVICSLAFPPAMVFLIISINNCSNSSICTLTYITLHLLWTSLLLLPTHPMVSIRRRFLVCFKRDIITLVVIPLIRLLLICSETMDFFRICCRRRFERRPRKSIRKRKGIDDDCFMSC